MKYPLVSIIIPSFNSGKFIKECLESIKKQTYQNIEVIVVDNNSKDNTRDVAEQFANEVFIHGPERSAQINFGATKTRGKYLYRVDSDFVLEKEVVEQCVIKCEKENLDGIAIHNTSAEGLGFWAEVRKLERNSYKDDNLVVAVRFFTKKAWEEVGGFDETLHGPEDYDFHNRFVEKAFKWGRIDAIERHLGEPKNIKDIWNKHYFYGKQMILYFKKYPMIASKQFIPVRKSYIRHFGEIIVRPKIFLGIIIMILVKFTAGGLGFISALHSKSETAHKSYEKKNNC